MKKLSTIALLLAIVVFVPVVYARSTVPVMEREIGRASCRERVFITV